MAKNTVILRNRSDCFEEKTAAGTITPGMLVALGSADTVTAHNSAGMNVLPRFAVEDEYQGKGIDDNYSSGDKVKLWIPQRGDQVNALLLDGETVVIGDYVQSGGGGRVMKFVAGSAAVVEYPASIIGQVDEAVDMSGSAGEDPSGRVCITII